MDFVKVLQRKPDSFKIATISDKELEDLCLEVAINNPGGEGLLQQCAIKIVDALIPVTNFKITLAQVFFRIGLVGLKTESHEKETWNDEFGISVTKAEIDKDSSIVIHPMYHRALGINMQKK